MRGRVVSVTSREAGSELLADVAISDDVLSVEDPLEFNWEDGGTLSLEGDESAYTVDPDTEELLLVTPLLAAHLAGDRVLVTPVTTDRWASVVAEDQEEELIARVPHRLVDVMPEGIRDGDTGEVVEVSLDDSGDFVVDDVLGVEPVVDGDFIDIITGALIRSSASGARWEGDEFGIRLYDALDVETVTFDAGSGQAHITGTFDFGVLGSQLGSDDAIVLAEQSASGYQTPALVQSRGAAGSGSSGTVSLPSDTSASNVLIAACSTESNRTHTTPAGWTLVTSVQLGTTHRVSMYRRDGGTKTFSPTFSGSADWVAQISEYSGLETGTAHDKSASSTGSDITGSLDGGTTAATTQTDELVVAFFTHYPSGISATAPAIERLSTSYQGYPDPILTMFDRLVTATGTQQLAGTADAILDYAAVTATFKAKAAVDADADAPDGNKLKIYVKPIGNLTWPTTRRASGAVRHLVQAIPNAAPTAPIISRGVEVITIGASAQGVSGTISHGLGHEPEAVHPTVDTSLGVANTRIFANVESLTSTTFKIRVRTNNDSNISGDVHVYWTAIG